MAQGTYNEVNEENMEATISTRQIWHAAVWIAAGLTVDVVKQSCSPRCVMTTPDTAQSRQLIADFDQGKSLDIPPKKITDAYIKIVGACRALQAGRVGGVME